MSEADPRFGGIERLYSARGLERLRAAKVCVVGVGGVGSWAAEALARSAVGQITLVDLDDICETNINRQLHSLEETIGQSKATIMAARIKSINSACDIRVVSEFFNETSAEQILQSRFDWVIDAIDQTANKSLLIARCRQNNIPIIASGGAGGRRDPLKIQIVDLSRTNNDALLTQVRKRLREEHGFPRDTKTSFNVPCVFSVESAVYPTDCKGGARINCDSGYGAASFVTGTFGLAAAGFVVSNIAGGNAHGAEPK